MEIDQAEIREELEKRILVHSVDENELVNNRTGPTKNLCSFLDVAEMIDPDLIRNFYYSHMYGNLEERAETLINLLDNIGLNLEKVIDEHEVDFYYRMKNEN